MTTKLDKRISEVEKELDKDRYHTSNCVSNKFAEQNGAVCICQVREIKSFYRTQITEIVRASLMGVLPARLSDKGDITMEMADGTSHKIRVDSDRAVFYNQAVSEVESNIKTLLGE